MARPSLSRHLPAGTLALILAIGAAGIPSESDAFQNATPAGSPAAGDCGSLFPITLPSGRTTCTHGPDPHPASQDDTMLPTQRGKAPTDVSPGLFCEGDGTEGNRVQAVYAYPKGQPDRYEEIAPRIGQWAAEVDAVFQASARRTGGTRRVRWVTRPGPDCELDVKRLEMAETADDTFDDTVAEFHHRGLADSDRKYLVWVDAEVICGQSEMWPDDRPDGLNRSNGHPSVPGTVSRIDRPCWGLGEQGRSVEAHELMHALGGVQASSPNGTAGGHCHDDADRMCYPDGATLITDAVCPTADESLFDCGGNDYFNAEPAPGSYLDRHWNAADSSFLTEAHPAVFITDAVATETPGGTEVIFTVTTPTPPPEPVEITVGVRDGTATAGRDFVVPDAVVRMAADQPNAAIRVPIPDDAIREETETFILTLSHPVNATLARREAVGTIVDDEPLDLGYTLIGADAGAFAFGEAPFLGSPLFMGRQAPVVAAAPTPSGGGYWLARRDGLVIPMGDAGDLGSTPAPRPGRAVVGIAATPSGGGYWLVWKDGLVEPFGDADDLGQPPADAPVAGIAATRTGAGYWVARTDGTVMPFGDAPAAGSAPAAAERPVVAIAAARSGYWVALGDGSVLSFGGAEVVGPAGPVRDAAVGLAATPSGGGCWLVAKDGGVFSLGDARFFGSTGALNLNEPIVGIVTRA